MTWVYKHRRAPGQDIRCDFECPEHGYFAASVPRDDQGNPPASHPCPTCGTAAEWRISAPFGKVKPWEVVRGGWEKPERPTYLDTRKLGEGQELDEFREDRRKIRDEQRHRELKELV